MDYPLVTIIIPCYNGERYVGEAIESALAQTYPHKEVIVIDDGSTDGSLEVIKSFGDRIRWESGPNRGGSAARNRGLKLARGELIQFLDADDLLHPQKLERQVPLAVEHPASIVYCDYVVQDMETGEVVEIPRRECDGLDAVAFAVKAERLSISAPLHWRRELEEVGGFDESLPCAQEYDLHIRLACHGATWYHLREVLYTVRQRRGSVSSDYSRALKLHPQIFRRAIDILRATGRDSGDIRQCVAGKLCGGGRQLLRFGRYEAAREQFLAARQMHPSGGLTEAYRPATRVLRLLIGSALTEQLVCAYRAMRSSKDSVTCGKLIPPTNYTP